MSLGSASLVLNASIYLLLENNQKKSIHKKNKNSIEIYYYSTCNFYKNKHKCI